MTMKMIVVGIGALLMANTAAHAAAKCTSVQAQCAIEVGGRCDPVTGRWEYGMNGAGGSNRGGAFDACVSRKLGRK
jgi:hypothetical protein